VRPGVPLSTGASIDEAVELVVYLLAATRLVPADKLALARGRAQQTGSLSAALVEEGVASSEGIARILATRHRLPLIDLAFTGVDVAAAKQVQLHVLERVVAIPYAFENDVLRVAVADPANLHGIDELRLATRYPLDLGIGSREEILAEIRKLVRASEAFGARNAVQEDIDEYEADAEEETDLEADDGVSDVPLVRLVNSVLFQAAEDGASDIHFVPQEDSLVVRFRIDGVLQEMQRIPKRMMPGVTTRLNEMGVEPFLTGAAISGVLAQRLARKLCSSCCEMYQPSADEMIAARVSPDVAAASDGMSFYRKRGCPRCNQTGYKGRVGIFQLLEMTEDLATLAAKHASREEIERAALAGGTRTLWDDGIQKVAAGLTSIEELARVTI